MRLKGAPPTNELKQRLGRCVKYSFICISLIGGTMTFIALSVLRKELPKSHPINQEYQECPMWG
jgi:hypothetical protein